VKPGREVWVTTNTGALAHGKIAAISDSSLIIREQDREVTIRLDDVRLVEGRDSLRNGFLIGTVSGAVAGGLMGSAVCDGNGPCGLVVLLTAAIGVPVGGLFGMMVDGLIPGRQTLFGSSTTIVTPVITPTGKAVNVAIRWR
jgi:outer membrane lipoprotein SlyB